MYTWNTKKCNFSDIFQKEFGFSYLNLIFPDESSNDVSFSERVVAKEEDGKLILTVELPGFGSDDIDATFKDRADKHTLVLTVKSKKKDEEKELFKYVISKKWDCENVKAEMKNGLLKMIFEKNEDFEKTIKVNIK